MAATSPDNIRTPNSGDAYNLVPDLATLAGDVQAALTRRANSYIGTTTQMNATAAPNGTTWWDTTANSLFERRGGVWAAYDSGWTNLTLQPGFTSVNSPQVRRQGDAVFLRGRIGGTFNGSLTTVATIPAQFLPTAFTRLYLMPTNNTTGATLGWGGVLQSGELQINAPNGVSYVALDTISYMR